MKKEDYCAWFCLMFIIFAIILGVGNAINYYNPLLFDIELFNFINTLMMGIFMFIIPLCYDLIKNHSNYSLIIKIIIGWLLLFFILLVISNIVNYFTHFFSDVGIFVNSFYFGIVPIASLIYLSIILLIILFKKLRVKLFGEFHSPSSYVKKERLRLEYLLNKEKNSTYSTIDKFEELIREAKRYISKGKSEYLKKSYKLAIENWKKAFKCYKEAESCSDSQYNKEKIKNNQLILLEDILNCYLNMVDSYISEAKIFFNKKNFFKSENRWNKALQYLESAKQFINENMIKYPLEEINKNIERIKLQILKLNIEKIFKNNKDKLNEAKLLKDSNLTKAIKIVNNIYLSYLSLIDEVQKEKGLNFYLKRIKEELSEVRNFQMILNNNFERLFELKPSTTNLNINLTDNIDKGINYKYEELKNERDEELVIKREYEFIGGQIRFIISIENKLINPITNLKILFDIPKSLYWVFHTPQFDRKGDSLIIPKIGAREKISMSLYFEPLSCMKSFINATISYFDPYDKPKAKIMAPKQISITCPIFFTKNKANLARVKNLYRNLSHKDKKIFPIKNIEKFPQIFNSILEVLNDFDIKLIFKSLKNNKAEAWFYGITKVKKNRIITHIIVIKSERALEIEVAGENEEQITSYLAEIGDQLRNKLISKKIIEKDSFFLNISSAIVQYICPYCGEKISKERIQKYFDNGSFKCKYCNTLIKNKDLKRISYF